MKFSILAGLLAASSAFSAVAVYQIDPSHSGAHFSIRHLMVTNVKGQFSNVKGTVHYDPQNPGASKVEATIDVSTVDTRQPKRDAHLKNADFFDVEKFPTMTFVSRRVSAAGPGKLKVVGDLTMHGVTKEVTLDVEGPTPEIKDPWGKSRIGASASTKINRRDFGLTWNKALETGGVVVGDEVTINIELALTKTAAQLSQTQ
jgi:polyisoprenoid-binding protein YceI